MSLDKDQREWIACEMASLSTSQVNAVVEGSDRIGFGSRLQQARTLRQVIEVRLDIVQSLEDCRAVNSICDSIVSLDRCIEKLETAEQDQGADRTLKRGEESA